MRVDYLYVDGLQLHPTNLSRVQSFKITRPVRTVHYPRPLAHGSIDHTRYVEGATVSISGFAWGITDALAYASWRDIEAAFPPDRDVVLTFRETGSSVDEYVVARLAGVIDEGGQQAPWWDYGLELLAADPRRYSVTPTTGTYDPIAVAGTFGLLFPLAFPLNVAGAAVGGTPLVVVNSGTTDTPPVYEVTGPYTNPAILNETTGEGIYTQNLELLAGQTLWIDVGNRAVRFGGPTGPLRPDYIDPVPTVWGMLAPGANQIRMTGGGGTVDQTLLTVTFRDARL